MENFELIRIYGVTFVDEVRKKRFLILLSGVSP